MLHIVIKFVKKFGAQRQISVDKSRAVRLRSFRAQDNSAARNVKAVNKDESPRRLKKSEFVEGKFVFELENDFADIVQFERGRIFPPFESCGVDRADNFFDCRFNFSRRQLELVSFADRQEIFSEPENRRPQFT